MAMKTHLEAIETALRLANKPLTSKELLTIIKQEQLADVSGKTPWKTLAARIAQDIVAHGAHSAFKRTYSGRYALRDWEFEPEYFGKRRKINPLEETIKAIPSDKFLTLITSNSSGLYHAEIEDILILSIDIVRSDAEEREDLVQIIPTFVIEDSVNVVSYKRTKRLPESRLHHTTCLNFGGHLQSEDIPALFIKDKDIIHNFLYRELYEELRIDTKNIKISYKGIIYLKNSAFERQHAGIVYLVTLPDDAPIVSLEPGMHTDLKKIEKKFALENADEFDSWSSHLMRSLYAG